MSDYMFLFPRDREEILVIGFMWGFALGALLIQLVNSAHDRRIWAKSQAWLESLAVPVRSATPLDDERCAYCLSRSGLDASGACIGCGAHDGRAA